MGWSSRIMGGVLVVAGLSAHAQEGSGLVLNEAFWGRWKPMASHAAQSTELHQGSRLVREFSLTSLSSSIPQGVRLTGGVTWGTNTVLSSSDTLSHTPTRIDQRLVNPNVQANLDNRTTAFVGLGYATSSWMDTPWRLQADLGVTMNLPNASKLGNNLGALEDTLRDIRLGPLMRVRLSYSF